MQFCALSSFATLLADLLQHRTLRSFNQLSHALRELRVGLARTASLSSQDNPLTPQLTTPTCHGFLRLSRCRTNAASLCFLLFTFHSVRAYAQTTPANTLNYAHPDTAQGPPTHGTLAQSGRESLDLGTLGLSVFLPVLDLPQRRQHPASRLHLQS